MTNNNSLKGGNYMNLTDVVNLINGLEKLGLTAEEITNFLKYVETGTSEYEPKPIRNTDGNV